MFQHSKQGLPTTQNLPDQGYACVPSPSLFATRPEKIPQIQVSQARLPCKPIRHSQLPSNFAACEESTFSGLSKYAGRASSYTVAFSVYARRQPLLPMRWVQCRARFLLQPMEMSLSHSTYSRVGISRHHHSFSRIGAMFRLLSAGPRMVLSGCVILGSVCRSRELQGAGLVHVQTQLGHESKLNSQELDRRFESMFSFTGKPLGTCSFSTPSHLMF